MEVHLQNSLFPNFELKWSSGYTGRRTMYIASSYRQIEQYMNFADVKIFSGKPIAFLLTASKVNRTSLKA